MDFVHPVCAAALRFPADPQRAVPPHLRRRCGGGDALRGLSQASRDEELRLRGAAVQREPDAHVPLPDYTFLGVSSPNKGLFPLGSP